MDVDNGIWTGRTDTIPPCKYNRFVDCDIKNPVRCIKCGWNPVEAERRKEIVRKELEESGMLPEIQRRFAELRAERKRRMDSEGVQEAGVGCTVHGV